MLPMKIAAHILILVCVSASCQKPPALKSNWSFTDNIGLAVLKSGKACLGIQSKAVAPNSPIRLVDATPPQKASDTRVTAADESCSANFVGSVEPDDRYYGIPTENAGLGFALAGFSGPFKNEGDLITADLDADGQPEYFRSCTSSEGAHFTVWTGKPLQGNLRWHRYYYLGYDVIPTCMENEVSLPK